MQLETQKHEVSQYLQSAHANRHAEARVSRCMNTRHAEGQVYMKVSSGMARDHAKGHVFLTSETASELGKPDRSRSLLPQMPPAIPIEDRGTAIPIEDRDRAIPEHLRLCGVIVKGLLMSLMWRKNDSVTSRKDHSARETVGASVDWTSFAKDSFSRYMNLVVTLPDLAEEGRSGMFLFDCFPAD
ncbi:hypothetical protein DY000_02039979 [Brassica cretica]|uniref:Uncharacterized protein n=1 Tax=Brassica cretica TaxID=69181 RepID=A0ABQ7BD10_BRACR|nr:hypothetical protein DY000_02039979 [Brassica cretica]